MSDTLRSGLIRLAYENPNLRGHLLPLLASTEKVAADVSDYADLTKRLLMLLNGITPSHAKMVEGVMQVLQAWATANGLDVRHNLKEIAEDLLYSATVPGKPSVNSLMVKKVMQGQYPTAFTPRVATKTAGGSGAANAAFLRQSPLKDKVLKAVAKHYGTSVSAIEAELTDPDAEAVFEYIGNDAALQMQVYREFNAKGFGKRAAAGIPVTLKKKLSLKDGTVIEAGEKGTLRFDEAKPTLAVVDFDVRPNTKLGCRLLGDYFGRPFMKEPSMSALEKMGDGIAKSVTGKKVEPDGYGPDGSPSWLLALGYI